MDAHPDYGSIHLHPGRWVLNLALAQKRHAGIDPHLVVQVPGATRDVSLDVEGVSVHYLAAPKCLRAATLFFFDVKRISRFVRTLKPEIVHAHGTEESYLLAAQASRFPSLVTLQGCYFLINRELPPAYISRARVIEFMEHFALRRTKHAIAKSNYIEMEVRKRFSNLDVHQIPNTFDPRLLEMDVSMIRQKMTLAFVGTVVERKGVHIIYEALARLPLKEREQIVFHIFGNRVPCLDAYENAVIEKLRTLLGGQLVTHGTIPAIEVARALTRIEVLIAPSLEEMFGNQLIEGLLAGCSAIVTELTAMAENIRRFGGGVVVAQKDPAELSLAIIKQLHSSRSMSDRELVRQKIDSYMGPKIVADKHADLYSEVLSQAPKLQ